MSTQRRKSTMVCEPYRIRWDGLRSFSSGVSFSLRGPTPAISMERTAYPLRQIRNANGAIDFRSPPSTITAGLRPRPGGMRRSAFNSMLSQPRNETTDHCGESLGVSFPGAWTTLKSSVAFGSCTLPASDQFAGGAMEPGTGLDSGAAENARTASSGANRESMLYWYHALRAPDICVGGRIPAFPPVSCRPGRKSWIGRSTSPPSGLKTIPVW